MTTTYSAIRSAQLTAIEALVPGDYADQPFRRFRADQPFGSWAEDNAHTAFRVFDISTDLDLAVPLASNTDIEDWQQSSIVLIAYPHRWGKYGDENRRALESTIEKDAFQIDQAIGVNGFASYVAGQHSCALVSSVLAAGDNATLCTLSYSLQYRRARS